MKQLAQIAFLLMLMLLWGCEKILDNNPPNPYTEQLGEDTTSNEFKPTSIGGLHQNIFAVRCANPTCHDGSFEPDFRTVQSTYASLVYHPVTKNDSLGSFTYRVMPFKPEESWLVHRVTTDDEVLGRMPLYAEELTLLEVEAIKGWIKDGARDMMGNVPPFPNLAPTVHGYQVSDTSGTRADTARLNGWASPMVLQTNSTYSFTFYITDDSTKTADLVNQALQFSLDRDNFSAFYSVTPTKLWDEVTIAHVNTANFPPGQTVYFRYSVEDSDGAATQMPNELSKYWWKNNYSLIVP